MKLSEHFTVEEFCDSEIAARRGLDNSLPLELLENARRTAQVLEKVRARLGGAPIYVSSGYRCQALNEILGSKETSDHRKALAADIKVAAFGPPIAVCRALLPFMDELGIGQLIYEHTWTHIGLPMPERRINRVLTVQGKDYIPGIVEA